MISEAEFPGHGSGTCIVAALEFRPALSRSAAIAALASSKLLPPRRLEFVGVIGTAGRSRIFPRSLARGASADAPLRVAIPRVKTGDVAASAAPRLAVAEAVPRPVTFVDTEALDDLVVTRDRVPAATETPTPRAAVVDVSFAEAVEVPLGTGTGAGAAVNGVGKGGRGET